MCIKGPRGSTSDSKQESKQPSATKQSDFAETRLFNLQTYCDHDLANWKPVGAQCRVSQVGSGYKTAGR